MSLLIAGGSLWYLAGSEPNRLAMPSSSKRSAFRGKVRSEVAPVSRARFATEAPKTTIGRKSSYSLCSGHFSRSSSWPHSSVRSTLLRRLPAMFPPRSKVRRSGSSRSKRESGPSERRNDIFEGQ
jgi:hypothetical protein